jgi:L-ascorbate metabolism protein UlaG (beta-lactamase superfamily)
MIINYYGISCFKIQAGETTIAIDPPSKKSGLKTPRFQPDIALTSHNHPRHNGANELPEKTNAPPIFLINGPGEYEIKGVRINGIKSFHDATSGEKYGTNTIYTIEIEKIKICHMGDFGEKNLQAQTKEKMGEIDILLIPVGGETVIDSLKSAEITKSIAPNIIIPMHYENTKILQKFLSEFKKEPLKPIEKLAIKKRDISEDEKMKIVVLESNIK